MNSETKNTIINALQNSKRINTSLDKNVTRGDIRLVTDPEGKLAGRYGVVIAINPLREIASVALLSNLPNLATVRDFVALSLKTDAPFDVTVITDGINDIELSQIANSPRIGKICRNCLVAIKNQSQSLDFDTSIKPIFTDCLNQGHYKIQVGDPVWNLRNQEFSNWNDLCLAVDENMLILREGLKIREFIDQNDFIVSINSNESIEIIQNLDSSNLDLIRC